jgi:hypothetical protein
MLRRNLSPMFMIERNPLIQLHFHKFYVKKGVQLVLYTKNTKDTTKFLIFIKKTIIIVYYERMFIFYNVNLFYDESQKF